MAESIKKRCLLLLPVVIAISSCSVSERVKPVDLYNRLQSASFHDEHVLIDIRSPQKFSDGHIAGAVNIELHEKTFEKRIAQINRGKIPVIYCGKGLKTDKALKLMKKVGFKKIYHLSGGTRAWKEAGFTLVK